MADEPDAELIAEGGRLARVNLWRLFAVSAVVAWIGARTVGGAAPWLRLAVVGLSCVLVYRGARWALPLLGFFTVLMGVLLVGFAVVAPGLRLGDRLMFAVLGVVQVSAFLILYNAPEVRAFLAAQRRAVTGAGK